MNSGIIYRATSPSGKCYIGQTTRSLELRKQHHEWQDACVAIHRAIKKYGVDNLQWDILHQAPEPCLNFLEWIEIMRHNSLMPNGYNLLVGDYGASEYLIEKWNKTGTGRGNRNGYKHSDETKKRMSDAQKKRWASIPRKPKPPKREPKVITKEQETQILELLRENPLTPDREIAQVVNVARETIRQIRIDNGLWTERRICYKDGKPYIYRVPTPDNLPDDARLFNEKVESISDIMLVHLHEVQKTDNEAWDLICDILEISCGNDPDMHLLQKEVADAAAR